jgi:hypothetical protein
VFHKQPHCGRQSGDLQPQPFPREPGRLNRFRPLV